MAVPSPSKGPWRATAGSAGLDLRSTSRLVLTPQMGVQIIDTDFKGPLDPDTVGLLIGRSSTALRGLIVHPGIIDPDFKGIVKIMVESPKGITVISPGDRIAQLIVLPSLHAKFPAQKINRGKKGFGSTGNDLTFLALDLDQRPIVELQIENRQIQGLLDTGADKSIIAKKDWPASWPIQISSQTLQGLGYAKAPDISARQLKWQDQEGHSGVIQPYVLDLPITLWGRDLLKNMGYKLTNEYSEVSQQLMKQMGHYPGRGIGKFLQGRTSPVVAQQRPDWQGLGFS